jgi:hypothetical protein
VDISELAHHLELIIIIPNTWLVEPIIFSSVCEECNNKTKEQLAIEGLFSVQGGDKERALSFFFFFSFLLKLFLIPLRPLSC